MGSLKLYKHQREIIKMAPKKCGVFLDTGLGKTVVAIKLADKYSYSTLVVAPKSVVKNWEDEIAVWSVTDYPKKIWKVVSKETFRRDWKKYLDEQYEGLIIDECHFFVNTSSLMHKNMVKYIKKLDPKCMYALSATPVPNTAWGAFGLEILFGRKPSYISYRKKFFHDIRMGKRIIPVAKKGMEKDIVSIIKKFGIVKSKEECLDLPEQVFKTEYFNLTPDQKKMIKRIDTHPLCSSHIVRFTKLHQLNGGTLKLDDEVCKFRSEKLNRLKEISKEYKKFIIVARYNAELEAIREALGERVVVVNGKTDNREQIFKDANKSEDTILAINFAISAGYNLQFGYDMMVFYSLGFSYVDYYQITGRIHRIKQNNTCVYTTFLINDTIDIDVYNALRRKEDFNIELYNK